MLLAAVLLSSASVFAQNENTIIQRGDMNGDGNIDISDVVALVNYILNREITVGVTGIELDKTELTIPTNETGTIKATIEPSNATNKNVNWISSDESVATVTSSTTSGNAATVRWQSAGQVTITAKAADDTSKSATCTVTCNPANIYYWYVGHIDPSTMDSIIPLSSNDASEGAGWRIIGTSIPTYSKNKSIMGFNNNFNC